MNETDLELLIARTAERTASKSREHFDAVAERVEDKVQLVAEGVAANAERMDRVQVHLGQFETEMRREFEEVRSMIRLSYTELDRRLRSLEETVSDLQTRMDRFESRSTH